MTRSGVLALTVAREKGGSGFVAICSCGYQTKPMLTKGLLAEHVKAVFPEHIKAAHLGPESKETEQ